jgi:outer membrane receptor protein involved in Fe transport
MEEVYVTATLRRVEMQDVPQSIQAFSGADIEKNNFQSLQDISNAIPSLNVVSEQPGRNSVVFRGISTGTQEFYTDSQVAIYFDEVPLTFNSQQIWPAMVDMERIEALPGPQGTLFGSASQGGTLRLISAKPHHNGFQASVFAQYMTTSGGDPSHDVSAWANIPIIEDTMAMRLVAYNRDEGGWIDNVYGETFVQPDPSFQSPGNNAHVVEDNQNTYNLKGARGSVLWDVSEDWAVTLSSMSEQGRSTGHWTWDPYIGEYEVTRFFDDWRTDEWWVTALTIEGDLGFARLTSSTTYLDREIRYEWDNANYEQYKDSYWGVYYGYAMYNTNYTYGQTFNEQFQDRFSQEIRLTSQGDSKFQWMIGGFYEDIYDEWFYGVNNPDLLDTTAWYYANYLAYFYNYYGYNVDYPFAKHNIGYSDTLRRSVEQKAIFGEVSINLTDQFNVTLGGRYFEFDRDEFHQIQFVHGIPPWDPYLGTYDWENFGVQPKMANDNDSIFKASATWSFDEDKMVYALFSQGFRLGGQNSQRAANTGLLPLIYESDTLDNFEVGLKSDWLDKRLRVNFTAFQMDFENYQFTEFGLDGAWWVRGIINGGTVRQSGYELDVTWHASDNLSMTASYSGLDSENRTEFTFPSGFTLARGDALSNSPEYKYRFGLDYVSPKPVFGGQLFMHFDYAAQDEVWNSLEASAEKWPDSRVPSSEGANFHIGLNMPDNWSVMLLVNNVFDDMWVNSVSSQFPQESEWFGDPRWRGMRSTQRPRSWGLNFRKTWE